MTRRQPRFARNPAVVALVLLLSTSRSAEGQSSWCRYETRALTPILDEHRDDFLRDIAAGRIGWQFSPSSFPSRVRLRFSGRQRRLSPDRAEFVRAYATEVLQMPLAGELFEHEVLFLHGADSLWIPTQIALMPAIEKQVPRGSSLTGFVEWIGAVLHEDAGIEWMFVLNEFIGEGDGGVWRAILGAC